MKELSFGGKEPWVRIWPRPASETAVFQSPVSSIVKLLNEFHTHGVTSFVYGTFVGPMKSNLRQLLYSCFTYIAIQEVEGKGPLHIRLCNHNNIFTTFFMNQKLLSIFYYKSLSCSFSFSSYFFPLASMNSLFLFIDPKIDPDPTIYRVSRKQLPQFYSKLLYKMG